MSDGLKKFVSENRQAFDTREPGEDLWEKIDAQMDVTSSFPFSSKWLSALKYLGFGASLLVIGVYFIAKSLAGTPAEELTKNKKEIVKDPELHAPAEPDPSKPAPSGNKSLLQNDFSEKAQDVSAAHATGYKRPEAKLQVEAGILNKNISKIGEDDQKRSTGEISPLFKEDTASRFYDEESKSELPATAEKALYIPEYPEMPNNYIGTLYDGSSLCSILHVYKFPGEVRVDKSGWNDHGYVKAMVKTISCSQCSDMKVVWLKGRTDKQITLSVKKFKNIVLVKSDGRQINPEAISHYYPGLGVIAGYKGKYFNMIFNDKVEMILLFKEAEEGDRILIDGTLEAIVRTQP